MFQWLKRIFMNDNTTSSNKAVDQTAKADAVGAAKPNQIIEREFEIAVYDVSINENTGKEIVTPVAFERPLTITARSKEELKEKLGLYRATGQIAKIIREVNAKPIAAQVPTVAQKTSSCQAAAVPAANIAIAAVATPDAKPKAATTPRYFKIGDIDVKDDNGTIYQKQWVKLTDSEASNIRVVNDKSNAIVNLAGKHIEMKKWILVNRCEDDVSSLEENL